jgi:hypothetical protein
MEKQFLQMEIFTWEISKMILYLVKVIYIFITRIFTKGNFITIKLKEMVN